MSALALTLTLSQSLPDRVKLPSLICLITEVLLSSEWDPWNGALPDSMMYWGSEEGLEWGHDVLREWGGVSDTGIAPGAGAGQQLVGGWGSTSLGAWVNRGTSHHLVGGWGSTLLGAGTAPHWSQPNEFGNISEKYLTSITPRLQISQLSS